MPPLACSGATARILEAGRNGLMVGVELGTHWRWVELNRYLDALVMINLRNYLITKVTSAVSEVRRLPLLRETSAVTELRKEVAASLL